MISDTRRGEIECRRWPDFDPKLAALGAVRPTREEARAAEAARRYMTEVSCGALALLPPRWIWLEGLSVLRGSTPRARSAPPVPVIMRAGLDYEATFITAVHELQHLIDVARVAVWHDDQDLERRADEAVARALGERWRWER